MDHGDRNGGLRLPVAWAERAFRVYVEHVHCYMGQAGGRPGRDPTVRRARYANG